MVLRALHLCSGYGGFELALRLAGIPAVTVAHVERDAYAAATLVARMDEAHLDLAPVWDDLETFDGEPWRGRVDLVTAGFPCQPFSQAGQRRGVDDERWLWPSIARILADVGPSLVFLENVPGLVRAGLPHVVADLADLGFDAEWGLLSASAVGAPHRRERFWLLAHAEGDEQRTASSESASLQPVAGRRVEDVEPAGRTRRPEDTGSIPGDESPDAGRATFDGHLPDGASEDVADTDHKGHRVSADTDESRREASHGTPASGVEVADAAGARRDQWRRQAIESPAVGRRGTPSRRFPPAPDDIAGWREWIAEGGPEPQLRRGTDGRPTELADALHLGGNGLVPVVAAHAFVELARRLGLELT